MKFIVTVIAILASKPTIALTQDEIDSIASQTTVVIANGLAEGDIEARQEFEPGSGVIVGRQGNTYYALTNTHVVQDQSSDKLFGVRTADGKVHSVADVPNNIIRLGLFRGNDVPIDGFDLAIVKFESDRDYPVVTMGFQKNLQVGDSVYISGWPRPADMTARRQRFLSMGSLSLVADTPSFDGGYNILYSNYTQPGMSGGPVLNSDGELIGIHGKGRARDEHYCIDLQVSIENSCGIQSIYFISQSEAIEISSAYNTEPLSSDVIEEAKKNKSRADVIPDIYKIFSNLRSLSRDCSTGVLIDDPDCNSGF